MIPIGYVCGNFWGGGDYIRARRLKEITQGEIPFLIIFDTLPPP